MTRPLTQLVCQASTAARDKTLALVRPADSYDGVRPLNIYGLRLVYALMFFVLGKQTWTHILAHKGTWDPTAAIAWCVWTAFATLAVLGIFRPLAMLPILLLEVFYKLLWLLLVAYPLWSKGTLAGSPAESTASAFAWVLLPIAVVPWGYAFVHYIYDLRRRPVQSTDAPELKGEIWPIKG